MTNRAKLYEFENCYVSNDVILCIMDHFPEIPEDKINEISQEWQNLHNTGGIIDILKNSVDDCSLVSDYIFPLLFYKYLMKKEITKDCSEKNIKLFHNRYNKLIEEIML